MGRPGGVLGVSGGILGQHGAFLGGLGPLLNTLGPVLWGPWGVPGGPLGGPWGAPGGSLGSPWEVPGTSDGFAILTRGLEGLVLKCLLSSLIICLSRDLAFLPPKTTPIILCPFLSTEATRLNPEAEV